MFGLVYVNVYQPMTYGNFGAGAGGALKPVTDGISDTAYIVAGGPGSVGEFGFSVEDAGAHPVTVLGGEVGPGPGWSVRWAPVHMGHDELVDGSFATYGAFPAQAGPSRYVQDLGRD